MNWIPTLSVYMNIFLNLLVYWAAIQQLQQQEHLYEQGKAQDLGQLSLMFLMRVLELGIQLAYGFYKVNTDS